MTYWIMATLYILGGWMTFLAWEGVPQRRYPKKEWVQELFLLALVVVTWPIFSALSVGLYFYRRMEERSNG